MERYKTEILSVADFLEERPDMEVHTDKTIQSAIYQVAGMLNAKTGGLIQKVWDYSVVDRTNNGSDNGFTQPDPNCVYFRTPEQLAFIKQAFVEQTQYNINLGNDYTQGGGSYSMGNVNSSYSKPVNFDTFAPMVEYLLQQARVLDLQSFLVEKTTTSTNDNCIPELEYDCKCITENYADKTYLKIYQPDAEVGRFAVINNANIITFEPQENVFTDYYTKSEIDNQQQLQDTQIGNNTTLLNQILNELKKFEPFVFVGTYNPAQTYSKSQVVEYNGEMYLSLQDNNNQPLTNTDYWIKFGSNIDLSEYAKKLDLTQDIVTMTTSQYSTTFLNPENDTPAFGLAFSNDNLEILNYPNISYTPTSNDSLVNKSYVDTQIANVPPPDLSNYYTKPEIDSKVDNINGEIDTIRNDLGNQVNENTNNINNCVKKNENDNIITAQRLLKCNSQVQTLFTFNNSREKKLLIDFGSYGGYRNWSHLILVASANTQLLDLYFKTANEGMWLNIEGNKINFDAPTLIGGVATPVGKNDVANKSYVDTQIANIPQPQDINLVEAVEIAIPNYKINGKQVYRKYCTTIQQLKDIFAISDYMSIIGLALSNGGHYKNCPWYWGSSQVFYIDSQSSGGIIYNGFQETGHKIVCEYTKR